jgi:hypothetical protein
MSPSKDPFSNTQQQRMFGEGYLGSQSGPPLGGYIAYMPHVWIVKSPPKLALDRFFRDWLLIFKPHSYAPHGMGRIDLEQNAAFEAQCNISLENIIEITKLIDDGLLEEGKYSPERKVQLEKLLAFCEVKEPKTRGWEKQTLTA